MDFEPTFGRDTSHKKWQVRVLWVLLPIKGKHVQLGYCFDKHSPSDPYFLQAVP